MQQKSDPHIFSGMQRDTSVSKHKAESLYDAMNIRFTARDGDTLLSITNEKGTLLLNDLSMQGTYLGHCVINDYVVVFTHGEEDIIYKVYPNATEPEVLYHGNLGFSVDFPIETLGIYENDKIQKVYWVDGKHQPRLIFTGPYSKIQPKDAQHPNADYQFDFVATLDLNEVVTISRKEGSGMFAPGTIQYAFSYYNKYGKQSNIFYTTLLQYISYPDRGGSPEDTIANCFEIVIQNIQMDFDYLRIYSIHRTSENAIPTVKRVADIELSTISSNSTKFIDNGQVGDIIDSTELLYIGGEDIVAHTMTTKDNTLFFGNLELNRRALPQTYKDSVCAVGKTEQAIKDLLRPSEVLSEYSLKRYDISNDYYIYANSLNWSSPGFKNREHYRLGIQFQHKSGKWSEPIFIGDYTFEGKYDPKVDVQNDKVLLKVPTLDLTIPIIQDIRDADYVKVRPLVIFPTLEDRLVLTQGILCPTVFSKYSRKNSSPFSQASWFFRPSLPKGTDCIPNKLNDDVKGSYVAYRHLESVAGARLSNDGNINLKSIEIQGSYGAVEEDHEGSSYTLKSVECPDDKNFFVDQSIITMHSPDIEWDHNFDLLNYTDWKLNIVGAAVIDTICSDVDIQTSSPQNLDAKGFTKVKYNTTNSYYAGGSLVSNLMWEDYMICVKPEDGKSKYFMYDDLDADGANLKKVNYLVYPWQRSGSLNNDENRSSDGGTRSAVLKKKVISNLKFSSGTKFFKYSNSGFDGKMNISQLQIFNSDQVSLVKIPLKNKSTKEGDLTYYGNVDTMLSGNLANYYITEGQSPMGCSTISNSYVENIVVGDDVTINKRNTVLTCGATPVRMKYKSSRHLIFGLTPNLDKSVNILPRVQGVPNDASSGPRGNYGATNMFWVDESYGTPSVPGKQIRNVNIYDDYEAMDFLRNNYPASELVILLDGGQDGTYVGSGPILGTVSIIDGEYEVRGVVAQADTFYIGTYYLHTVQEGPKRCFIKNDSDDPTSVVETEIPNLDVNVETEDGETITLKPFTIHQNVIPNSRPEVEYNDTNSVRNAYLLIGELYKENPIDWDSDTYPYFSGKTDDAIKSNLWIPAGLPVKLGSSDNITIHYTQGDTWYTRYDCLKTYPFTMEDENSIVEICSFLCESRINGDGRYDRNRGQISNLTMSPINFNLLNPVYNNKDNFFNYRILDEDYYTLNKFSNQITWSKEKQMAADIDLWTNITMANTFDLDGTMGPIEALRTWQDTIYCFQDNAISVISFNPRVQIPTSDGVPIEISNSYKLEGKVYISDSIGCSNKQTIAITPSGIYFVDPNSKEFYHIAGKELSSISASHGFSDWFKHSNITHTFYDKNRNDVYILGNDNNSCIVYSELLGQFTSFMSYNGTPAMFNIHNDFYAFRNNDTLDMYKMFAGEYNDFFGTLQEPNYKPFYIHFISNADSSIDKIFSTIETRVDFRDTNDVVHDEFFDYLKVWNEYQTAEKNPLTVSISAFRTDAKKKFRVWRVNIPRCGKHNLERIRNTWTNIKLGKNSPGNLKMELHDLNVQYFI